MGLWERGCGVFVEGNDVERHLDRPPSASPFQTGRNRSPQSWGAQRIAMKAIELGGFGE